MQEDTLIIELSPAEDAAEMKQEEEEEKEE